MLPESVEAHPVPMERAETGRRAAETWNGRPAWTSGFSKQPTDEGQESALPLPGKRHDVDANLADALSREGDAIRARMAADGTWHARFRSPDGPVAVRIARQRDGTLAVTVRGPRQALAQLDGTDMAAVLQRPIRLEQQPVDASRTV
jgi:hypothetical protein